MAVGSITGIDVGEMVVLLYARRGCNVGVATGIVATGILAVSYTHLTLPTTERV